MALERFDENIDITRLSLEQPEAADLSELDPAQYLSDADWQFAVQNVFDRWKQRSMPTKDFLFNLSCLKIMNHAKAIKTFHINAEEYNAVRDYMSDKADYTGLPQPEWIHEQAYYLLAFGDYHDNSPDIPGSLTMVDQYWRDRDESNGVVKLANLLADLKILIPANEYVVGAMWPVFKQQLKEFVDNGQWSEAAELAGCLRLVDPKEYEKFKLGIAQLQVIKDKFIKNRSNVGLDLHLGKGLKILAAKEIDLTEKVPKFVMYPEREQRDPSSLPEQRSF